MPTLHGVPGSPFVRKVIVALAEKGIEYEHVKVMPFGQTEEYLALSPTGKIPCYEDKGAAIPDSSVIIDYLEHAHPTPALYPTDAIERAKALYLEEYADTAVVGALTVVFRERFIKPNFFKEDPDEAVIKESLEVTVPPVFDYLESRIEGRAYLMGADFTIADISVASRGGPD